MRSEQEVNKAIEQYSDMVLRLCTVYVKNGMDAEDIFQTVFLKYALHRMPFENTEHEKAWLIRVTVNACKDLLKSHWRKTSVSLDAALHVPAPERSEGSLLAALELLPPKYRVVIYLYYFEGYAAKEIADILGLRPATVNTQLSRGRERLKTLLEQEGFA